ncbi:MAG: SprT family zinc-dependent metalloprotease [Terrabacter sp.]
MDLKTASVMGRQLMEEHALHDWTLVLDRAKTRAGACRPARREIALSAPLTRLHDEAEVRDTLLHEIAHALVGARHGHDPVWQAKALEIGCSGQRCSSAEAPTLEGVWRATCPAGHTLSRHRRPTRVGLCGRCSGPPRDRVFGWTLQGRSVDMHPNYVAELAALLADAPQQMPGTLGPGQVVRVTAPGQYDGRVGPILRRGRSNYKVRLQEGVLSVPFAWVEAAG